MVWRFYTFVLILYVSFNSSVVVDINVVGTTRVTTNDTHKNKKYEENTNKIVQPEKNVSLVLIENIQ